MKIKSPKKIYTIIVNHNGKKFLKGCFDSLQKVKVKGYKHTIVVVDNASLDGSVEYIEKKYPKIRLKILHRNKGFTGGVNFGLRYALKHQVKYVLLLNYDTIVNPNFLQKLVSYADKKPKVGILSPLILFPGLKKRIWFSGGKLDPVRFSGGHVALGEKSDESSNKPYLTEYISGCSMLIKNQVLDKIGLLDDRFFLYYEDVDFCLRAQKMGYQCAVVPEAKIVHLQTRSMLDDPHKEYYLTRNHLLLVTKHASFRIKIREYIKTLMTAMEKFEHQDDDPKASYTLIGVKDYFLRRFGKREHWY